MQSPPLLVSFSVLDDFLKALPDDYAPASREVIARLHAAGLPPVTSVASLAILFGFSSRILTSMAHRSDKFYRVFRIHKGRGRYRVIQAPRVALKVIQKWLSFHLAQSLTYPAYVHGFVPGRSHLTAAQCHVGSEWVYSLDIENFFPTTSMRKVTEALRGLGYNEAGAKLIANLCCYSGNLSQGSPASPVLSNLVFREVDARIAELAVQLGITYTRYADDLVFSGHGDFPEAIKQVKEWIGTAGWTISEEKEHFAKLPKERLKVHGLLVHGNAPILTKGYRKKIRTYKFLLSNQKIKEDDVARIMGHLSYAKFVEGFSAEITQNKIGVNPE